jgi:(1->4)-alpha-D-glucan 1-alpha-D-glucosylmutase
MSPVMEQTSIEHLNEPYALDEERLENEQKLEAYGKEVFETVKKLAQERQQKPSATYRVQLNKFFTFENTADIAPYLAELGVSHLYASPYLQARPESLHGYDITNHAELNPSIGTKENYNRMVETLHNNGLRQILDTVPNHMGIGEPSNRWWMDVLENGPLSVYATYFDIDWQPINPKLSGKVLLPVLGDQYGRVLDNGELQLRFASEEGVLYLAYYDRLFPIDPYSYRLILQEALALLQQTDVPETDDALLEFQSILTAVGHLPHEYPFDCDRIAERNREKEIIKRRLQTVCQTDASMCDAIHRAVATFNGAVSDIEGAARFDRLDALLEEQYYRLSFWRVAAEEINYRRFFDVNELAAVRVDQPEVFEEIHKLIFQLLGEGSLDGLRIDHVDGLLDPAGYFVNLQRRYLVELARFAMSNRDLTPDQRESAEKYVLAQFDAACKQTTPDNEWLVQPLYVVVEKILAKGESLPGDWTVAGTTGYEFTNAVNGLFVDAANEKALTEAFSTFTGEKQKFADLIYEKKRQIMRLSLASEITILTNMLNRISAADRHYRDFTLNSLRNAIREVIACFPVYRTYMTAEKPEPDKRDRSYVEMAINKAKKRNPATEATIFDFLKDVLLLNFPEYVQGDDPKNVETRQAWLAFTLKFQQCSGPLMAKGLEDTAFYIYNRLVSLNEVGGEPDIFGISPVHFHRQQAERQNRWRYSILASSTHDTKRSEDVRARINVLSEMPRDWKTALTRWGRYNRKLKISVDGTTAPDRNEEYFLYQTLLGVWHFPGARSVAELPREGLQELTARLQEYMNKALNEAKVNSSWVNQNDAYLSAVRQFVARLLDPDVSEKFLSEFMTFQRKVAYYGAFNSLSQTLIKLTSPGVPDIYQGNEIWDFSLVDPDNRRLVDYQVRRRMVKEVTDHAPNLADMLENLPDSDRDGCLKLLLTNRLLVLRREYPELFGEGSYNALNASGTRSDNVVAYARRSNDGQELIIVAPRLLGRFAKGKSLEIVPVTGTAWDNTLLELPDATPGTSYINLLSDEKVDVREGGLNLTDVFAVFPFAALLRENP